MLKAKPAKLAFYDCASVLSQVNLGVCLPSSNEAKTAHGVAALCHKLPQGETIYKSRQQNLQEIAIHLSSNSNP